MSNIFDVANWFLNKESMTPKKLQKLCYYAYAWVLTLTNENMDELQNRLFNEKFQAWVHGPVNNNLYQMYKSYGYEDIPQYKSKVYDFPPYIESVLNEVWEVYGHFTANELENISHQEDPWIITRKGLSYYESCTDEIDDKLIFKYYTERMHGE